MEQLPAVAFDMHLGAPQATCRAPVCVWGAIRHWTGYLDVAWQG